MQTGDEATQFTITPPDFPGGISSRSEGGFIPQTYEAAWILEIVKTKLELKEQVQGILDSVDLPENLKQTVFKNISIYVDNASLTNISSNQVIEFILGFEVMWSGLCIYVVKTKMYRGLLNFIHDQIKEIFIMNLNKSIEGWMGNHIFEKKSTYDIRQSKKDPVDKVGWWMRKRKPEQIQEAQQQ